MRPVVDHLHFARMRFESFISFKPVRQYCDFQACSDLDGRVRVSGADRAVRSC